MKIKVDELLRLALIHAECDRRGFAICNDKHSPEYIEAIELADAFNQYRMKRWGRTIGEKYESEADAFDARTGIIFARASHNEAPDKP